MADRSVLDELREVIEDLVTMGGQAERTSAFSCKVQGNSTSTTPPPVGYVRVFVKGIATLARYFGLEPAINDQVDVLVIGPNATPIIIQNHGHGLVTGWPFDNTVKVDPTNPAADYSTVAAAFGGASANENIIFGPATYSCLNQTPPGATTLSSVSQDWAYTILQSLTNNICLAIGASNTNFLDHLTFKVIRNVDTATVYTIYQNTGGTLYIRDCYAYAQNTSSTNAYAYALAAYGTVYCVDSKLEATSNFTGATAGVYAGSGGTVYLDAGCRCNGSDYDVYAATGGAIVLNGCILENGTLGGAGTIKGWWRDTNGNIYVAKDSGDQYFEGVGLLYWDADQDTYDDPTLGDDRIDRYVGGAARMRYDDEGITSLERITQSVWHDQPLEDPTDGDHFRQYANAVPTGWTLRAGADTPVQSRTNRLYSFWFVENDSPAAPPDGWDYDKQTAITIESLPANQYMAFQYGPFMFRDGQYAADLDYYFAIHGQTAGAIDLNKYVRLHLQWVSASAIWRIRGESDANDGGGQTASGWTNLDLAPIHQPIFLRIVIRNDAGVKTTREYWGAVYFPLVQQLLQSVSENTTWGQVYWRVHQLRSGGINDYWFLGGVDTFVAV